jgi:serine protease Do
MNMSAEDIYEMACSQVVGIRTEMTGTGTGGFFGAQQGSTVVSGSGFIISSDGYILTNYHVVETAYLRDLPLVVSLHDGTEFDASVIGYEASNDVALLKIEASELSAAVIANSDSIRVGQPVYAVGNPFGDLVYTMTEGIVSALDRIVTVEQKSIDAFQFSAAVNSGNSGGPVYDTNGEVIGIVSAKIMGEYVEGIGFAIPINDAIDIAAELIEHGYITGRPLIGITVSSVNAAQADYFDMVVGAYVLTVTTGSAAEKAGVRKGDIITALGDAQLDSKESLIFALRKYKAGDTATLTIWRNDEEIKMTVTFDENLVAGQPQRSQDEQPGQPQQPVQPYDRVVPPGDLP